MSNTELPPNCPMKKADYEHYCPSKSLGPLTYEENGKCFKQDECTKIVKDFKEMNVPTTDTIKFK